MMINEQTQDTLNRINTKVSKGIYGILYIHIDRWQNNTIQEHFTTIWYYISLYLLTLHFQTHHFHYFAKTKLFFVHDHTHYNRHQHKQDERKEESTH